MTDSFETSRSGISGAAASLITLWAVLGGALLLVVVIMNVLSVIGAAVWVPLPGDFEMTEIGVAVAVFMFLPYCELTGSNVTADIFTARAGPRTIAFFKLLGSIVAVIFSLLLLWRNYANMQSQKEYEYTTAILQFPTWVAFIPILVSLALLAVAACLTLLENGGTVLDADRQ
ncbi:TRAP transporter small permease [Algicella marina]|uniref:TRAP transporter small permease n=1 Tax=Algicella marina TaxID=2683284 RepID=UPI0024DF38CB|nr:TRAP transporter small permease [Algicella marina]